MADPIALPPGAALVDNGQPKLPPGATMVSPGRGGANYGTPRTNETTSHFLGDAALKALPYAGAIAGSVLAPEAVIPAMFMAGAGGAAGSAVEQGARAATGINPPATLSDAAKEVAEQGAGNALGEGVGKGIGWFAGKTLGKYLNPERLYQSALKPVISSTDKPTDLVATGLRERIPLGNPENAKAIVTGRIDDLGKQVSQAINNYPQNIYPSEYVPTVQSKLDALRDQWGRSGSQGVQFVNQIDKAERHFLLREGSPRPLVHQISTQVPSGVLNSSGQPIMKTVTKTVTENPEDMDLATLRKQVGPISSPDAQAIKQATYQSLRAAAPGAYAEGSHPGLSNEIEQELAGSMRHELERIYPEISDKNARQGDLMSLNKAIGRFIGREGNKQVTPYFAFPAVGAALGFGAAGAEGSGIGGAAGILGAHLTRQMLEDPGVKSALAIMLNRARGSAVANAASRVSTANAARSLIGTGVALSPPQTQ